MLLAASEARRIMELASEWCLTGLDLARGGVSSSLRLYGATDIFVIKVWCVCFCREREVCGTVGWWQGGGYFEIKRFVRWQECGGGAELILTVASNCVQCGKAFSCAFLGCGFFLAVAC